MDYLLKRKLKKIVVFALIIFLIVLCPVLIIRSCIGGVLTSSADNSKVLSNYNLANSYYSSQNYEKAVRYYKLAAKAGHADSQYSLGICYENGLGVHKSLDKAISWFEKAARNGSSAAKVHLLDIKKKNKIVE